MITQQSTLEHQIINYIQINQIVSIKQLALGLNIPVHNATYRRAIQRALKKLIEKGQVEAEGYARARVYRIPKKEMFNEILLSSESSKLLTYLSKPSQVRAPVGYNSSFLHSYKPNQTYYLDPDLREAFKKIGAVEIVTRPAGTYARAILNRLLIDLSWNSSRLEGNTYSLLETKRLIEFGENAAGKDLFEAQMILNHKEAIEYIIASADESVVTAHEICSIHALLSNNLLGDSSASGRIRNIAVRISGTPYIPIENPHLLKEYLDLFLEKFNLIADPFEQSFFALVHLSYLQAFEDVNKRTARLTANISFIKNNLKPLSFIDVNQQDYVTALLGVYEKNDVSLLRDLYAWAYNRSAQRYSALQQSLGEPNIFKIKHRQAIQNIIQHVILNKITHDQIVQVISHQIDELNLSESVAAELMQIIETEIMSLHEGNIARFKIRPSEYEAWKNRF